MERVITKSLLQWKEKSNRKPLIVRGARQTGKSWTITTFGKDHFEGTTHILNFEKRPDLHQVFELNFEIPRIIAEIEILLNKKITPGKDLLFFDEIQECPKAIVSLRYFYEQIPDLHLIAAGSLLEFSLNDIPFPVGRVQLLNMYPMSFHEFLNASGKAIVADLIMDTPKQLSESVHLMLIDELRKYFFVGGMPECVKIYIETNSLQEVFEIQSDLISTFRQDFNKFAGKADTRCLDIVLLNASQKVGEQIKYTEMADGFSSPTIKKAFILLETARLYKRVRASSPAGIPLGASASEKKFKAVMLDIGLMANLNGLNISKEYLKSDLLSIFRGAMAEQFVGQEILAATNDDLYYWAREAASSSAETDFLVEKLGKVIPIEVKSGKSGSLKSLHLLLETYKNVENAYVFSNAAFGQISEQKITFLPLYYTASAVTSS
jgi:predicted AAA+ superfamily ATPase